MHLPRLPAKALLKHSPLSERHAAAGAGGASAAAAAVPRRQPAAGHHHRPQAHSRAHRPAARRVRSSIAPSSSGRLHEQSFRSRAPCHSPLINNLPHHSTCACEAQVDPFIRQILVALSLVPAGKGLAVTFMTTMLLQTADGLAGRQVLSATMYILLLQVSRTEPTLVCRFRSAGRLPSASRS